MKKIITVIVIIAILVVLFIVGVEVSYNNVTNGQECCSCCDETELTCISACCKCNYNIFEKLDFVLNH